eukprot:scaffold157652_cov23-Tisochrysis_lutea.AAC.1
MQGARRSAALVERLAASLQQRLPTVAEIGTFAPGSIDLWARPLRELQQPHQCLWPRGFSSSSEVVAPSCSNQQPDSHVTAFAKLTPKAVVEKLDQFIVSGLAWFVTPRTDRHLMPTRYIASKLFSSIKSKTPSLLLYLLQIGQTEAKKAVAVAFRNRWRRHHVKPAIKDSISPKNILMIGEHAED